VNNPIPEQLATVIYKENLVHIYVVGKSGGNHKKHVSATEVRETGGGHALAAVATLGTHAAVAWR
jgi:hypothetical protein